MFTGKKWLRLIAALMGLALVAAACGSDSSDSSGGAGDAPSGDVIRASVTFKTTAGNQRRELTQEVIQEQAKAAGFEIVIDNQAAGDLFGDQLPKGDYQLSLYAQVATSLDPVQCSLFCSENIPSDANAFSGQNWQRVNIPELDPLLKTVDTDLDDDARAVAQKEADAIEAEQMISLPLDPLPNILIWSTDIEGPVENNPILGPFANAELWTTSAGSELEIGAEQEPDCMDWIASCSGASWGYWTVNVNTMPRTFDIVPDGDSWAYSPNSLLVGEPTLETDPAQVVTYDINPDAVWDDGTPITSTDFKYTFDQIANGEDIYDQSGYSQIESVDDSDPSKAVVTFTEPYAPWKSLFGGQFGILPSHLLDGQDRAAIMAEGYEFSGGPWKLEAWNKGESMVLVPNENFWGDIPSLERITFKIIPDTSAYFQAYKAGEVAMIFPQPQLDGVAEINAGLENSNTDFTADTGNLEALWINNSVAPFDSVAVRQAFAHSLNRDEIVAALFGDIGIDKASQSLNPPIMSFFTDVDAWGSYTQDLDKVTELMEGDGWTKGDDGIWQKPA